MCEILEKGRNLRRFILELVGSYVLRYCCFQYRGRLQNGYLNYNDVI